VLLNVDDLGHFCLFPALFCYVTTHVLNFESQVQFTDRCALVKVAELSSAGAVGITNRLLFFKFKNIFAYCGASISYVTALIIIVTCFSGNATVIS
jgi:hypothetical protein